MRISHKFTECIGCMYCTEVAPNYWQLDEDGVARLLRVTRANEDFEYGDGFSEDREALKDAEESCPVDIIKVEG